jgi:hypothetical protein
MRRLGSRRLIEISARAAQSGEPETVLGAAAELRREIAAIEVEAVERALARGCSWSTIARALGISKQAAHKRYARRTNHNHPGALTGERHDDPKPGQVTLFVTDGVKDAIRGAQLMALVLDQKEVCGAHVILGLLLVEGAARDALREIGAEFSPTWRAVKVLDLPRGEVDQLRLMQALGGQVPVSPAARSAIKQSLHEARRLSHLFVGVEHLLLALLRRREPTVVAILSDLGVSRIDLERCLGRLLMTWKPASEPPSISLVK